MPTYQSPGVYVEEMEAGARPIEGVGTAVAAFVGLASSGPFNAPTLITNWSQFTGTFGEFVEGSYLHHAVYGYFQNGGGTCFVVRIGGNGAASPAARAELTTSTGGGSGAAASLGAFRVQALAEGAEGNDITVEVADTGTEGAAERRHRGQRPVQTDPPRGSRCQRRGRDPGHGRPLRRRSARACTPRPRRLRRRSVGPDRFRRPGGDRRGDHGRRT